MVYITSILIIGAGITGACFARFSRKGHVKILEKETYPGGKCRTYTIDSPVGPFVFDIGGHWFHCQSHEEIYQMFSGLNSHVRNASIYLHEKYIRYPIQNNYQELDDNFLRDSIEKEINLCNNEQQEKSSFYSKMLKDQYGPTLYRLFFEPYNRKMLGITDISSILTSRYESIRNFPTNSSKGYNNKFYYPKNEAGIQQLVNQLLEGTTVEYQSKVVNIDMNAMRLELENGDMHDYEVLVNTMPLKTLLHSLHNETAEQYAKQLQNSSTYIYNIGILSDSWGNRNWIYFPEENIPFYRIGCYSVVNQMMAPQGCHALYMESTLELSEDEIAKHLKKLGFIHKYSDLLVVDKLYIEENYCFYSTVLSQIHKWLRANKIYSIGRYGGWRWSSMHEDIYEAQQTANILCAASFNKSSNIIL